MTALPPAEQFAPSTPPANGVVRMQRSKGHGRIIAKNIDGASRLATLFQEGSARIRLPKSHSAGRLEAVLLNTSGGMTGGDMLHWEARAGERCHLTLASQTAERLYRSPHGVAGVQIDLSAATGACLHWLPQETIMFDGGRMRRRIEADLDEDAELLICEPIVFGRGAMGESVANGSLHDDWRIRRGGRLVHAEALRLDGALAEKLQSSAVASNQRAVATVVLLAARAEALLQDARAIIAETGGASHLGDRLVCRLAAPDALTMRRRLIPLLILLRGGHALPRCWYC